MYFCYNVKQNELHCLEYPFIKKVQDRHLHAYRNPKHKFKEDTSSLAYQPMHMLPSHKYKGMPAMMMELEEPLRYQHWWIVLEDVEDIRCSDSGFSMIDLRDGRSLQLNITYEEAVTQFMKAQLKQREMLCRSKKTQTAA